MAVNRAKGSSSVTGAQSALLFCCFAVEVLAVDLRIGAGMVDDAVPMIRWRVERIEFQRNTAGIDGDVSTVTFRGTLH